MAGSWADSKEPVSYDYPGYPTEAANTGAPLHYAFNSTGPPATRQPKHGRGRGYGRRVPVQVSLAAAAQHSEEEMEILKLLEAEKTAESVLEVAFMRQLDLTPEMTAEALHVVARRLPTSQQGLASNDMLSSLLRQLWHSVAELQSVRSLSQLPWTLGKLCMRADPGSPPPQHGMDECMLHVCRLLPSVLPECSHVDLTNMLWGLARLFPGGADGAAGDLPQVNVASHAIIQECTKKLPDLTAQCLANSFWATARLKLHGPDVEDYVARVLVQLNTAAHLRRFSSQGLANMLWALAQLRATGAVRGPQDNTVHLALVALAEVSASQLEEFQPQELSMVAWSLAKLYESKRGECFNRSRRGRCASRPFVVDEMLTRLAGVATQCIDRFEDQGISNIAWAMATLELTGATPAMAPVRDFMEAAMRHCTSELGSYSAQAIANLLWACVRVDFPGQQNNNKRKLTMKRFCSTAAQVMMTRMSQVRCDRKSTVTWRDLSSVATALSYGKQNSKDVMSYMSLLVQRTAEQVAKGNLPAQQILNISQSAARLRMPPSEMQTLVNNIEVRIASGRFLMNDVDRRQWNEVQQWCSPKSLERSFPPPGDIRGMRGDATTAYGMPPMMATTEPGSPSYRHQMMPAPLPEGWFCASIYAR